MSAPLEQMRGRWVALLAALVPLLGGCGGSGTPPLVRVQDQAACPGGKVAAPPPRARCPYRAVGLLGNAGEGVLRQPEALAVAPDGNIYVADQFSHEVQVFSPGGRFLFQWGSYGSLPGQFGSVGGLAFGPEGNLYLVDSTNDRIERFTPRGRLLGAWGSFGHGTGQFVFGAGNGPSEPPGGGIAVSARYVYVSDTHNNRIERFTLTGGAPRVIARAGSAAGAVERPEGLAVGPGPAGPETLYVADNGNLRVEALGPGGRFFGAVSSIPAVPSTFQNPYALALKGNRLYVVDDNHGRVVVFTAHLHFVETFGGEAGLQLTPFVRSVAVGNDGTVYVADAHGNDIVAFSEGGRPLFRFGISANAAGQFVDPLGVAFGPAGEGLVVERYAGLLHLRGLVPLAPTLGWSSGGEVYLGDLWFSPRSAAFAADGTIWVSDANNAVVRHLTYGGLFLGAVGNPPGAGAPEGPPRPGYAAPSLPGAVGGAVYFAPLVRPSGVALLSRGLVVVSDPGASALFELSPDGKVVRRLARPRGGKPFLHPEGLAPGPKDTFYLAEAGRHEVEQITVDGRLLRAWPVPPPPHPSPTVWLPDPAALAVGPEGDLFVSEGALDRIEKYGPKGEPLAVFGAPGTGAGELSDPAGLAFAGGANLVVADSGNNRLAVFYGAGGANRR